MTIIEFIEAPNSIEFDYLCQKNMDLQLSRVQAEYRRYKIWKKTAEVDFLIKFLNKPFFEAIEKTSIIGLRSKIGVKFVEKSFFPHL